MRKSESKPITLELNAAQKKSLELIRSKYGKVNSSFQRKSTLNAAEKRQDAEARFRAKEEEKGLPKQLGGHTLKSVSRSVIARYRDRPFKLRQHLPFAVDYDNVAFNTASLKHSGSEATYAKNIRDFRERMDYLSRVGSNPEEDAVEKRLARLVNKRGSAAAETNPDASQVHAAKDLLLTSAPQYQEEDVLGLRVHGASVYDSEKKSLLNTIDELLGE